MEQNLIIYCDEIAEFLSAETLEKIDYGILDLSKIPDMNLKELLLFFEDVLTLELEVNYQKNNTGLFRVEIVGNKYCYKEFGHVIEADSIFQLKELVLRENRIWYVFDEVLANKFI